MNQSTTPEAHRHGWIYLLLVLVFGVLVYRDALVPGRVLFTTDDNIGAIGLRKSTLPHAFLGGWDDSTVAGQPMNTPVNFTNLVLSVLSPRAFVNWIHAIDLILGSWFFMLFLRLRGIGWMAATLGALLAYWLGSTFFLTYAGHIGKFGVVLFTGLYLYSIERAVRDRSIAFAVLAGASMAGMFVEQSDSALFFATVLGPYAVFRCWQSFGRAWSAYLKILVPVGVVTAMIGFHAVYAAYSFYRLDKPEASAGGDSWQELWDYCTQWSWPPSETIEFIAPGYMGWRSGEPTGPYWGALGRSAQWQPQFGPNGMNFKLETFYKGLIPLLFLALGLYHSLIRKRDDRDQRQQALFWTIAMGVTFLLSCGKYTPLYRLFFELPGVSSIRNPVKFMQITQFAMAYLAAIGLDYWLTWLSRRGTLKQDPDQPVIQRFARFTLHVAIVFSVFALLLLVQSGGAVASFAAQGWQDLAKAIVSTRSQAMVHAAVMAWIAYGLFRLGFASGGIKHTSWRHLGAAVLVVMMVDQLLVSRRYVQSVETASLVSEGALIPALQQGLGHQRGYLWNPPPSMNSPWGGLYNQWSTILFPYYQVPLLNIAQMRMPEDYKAFFGALGSRPALLWSHLGLGMALAPADFWMQVRNDPSLRGAFEPVAGFNVVPAGKTGATTVLAAPNQPSQHVLLQFNRPADRFALIGAWNRASLAEAVAAMAQSEPFATVQVDPEGTAAWPAPGEPGRVGDVTVTRYRSGRMALRIPPTDREVVLRAAEKYAADWRAWVDGVEQPVVRADAVFLGVLLPPADREREVVLAFHPQRTTLYVQFAGMGLAALALLGVLVRRRG